MSGTALKRLDLLLDPNSFIEIGGSVTARSTDYNRDAKKEASDGVVCGYGTIDGNLVYVYSQDPDVLKGTLGEMHGKKIVGILRMAEKMGAPVIGLLDRAGIRIEESMDALSALGDIYKVQSELSGVIPQITAVFGNCGGGLSFIPAISDFVFVEKNKGRLFVNSPDAIKGNNVNKVDNTKAEYQAECGNASFAGTQEEIMASIRSLVCMLPANYADDGSMDICTDDINRTCAGIDSYTSDTLGIIQSIADNGQVFINKNEYGRNIITALIKMNGYTTGVVANRKTYSADGEVMSEFDGELSNKAVSKAASFINFCDAFNIPIVTIAQAGAFYGMECTEKNLPANAARLIYAYANSTVPKITLNIGNCYGSAGLIMGSKAVGADMVYAWNSAQIGAMRPDEAAKIICEGDDSLDIKEVARQFEDLQLSVASAAARGYVDTIIAPEDTRKYIIGALEMLFTKRQAVIDKKHGTV